MKTFYRYVRPLRFNHRRMDFDTVPRGGVALRLDENLDGTLRFTHARCHSDEMFSKTVARQITDQRAEYTTDGSSSIPASQDVEKLVQSVIEYCFTGRDPTFLQTATYLYPAFLYHQLELRELGEALKLITAMNQREYVLADFWKAGIAAAHHGDRYANLSR